MTCPDDILEEFIGLYESGEVREAGAFAARFPESQRAAIRSRCEDFLRTRAELMGAPVGSMAVGNGSPRRVGRYDILRVLGAGGMGTVYEGRDAQGEHCAIKVLHPHLGISSVQRKRLRLEHLVGSGLRHPHLVEVVELGEDGGSLHLVMRPVMSGSLADEIRAARERGEPIAPDRVVDVGIAIGEALVCLHGHQVIHRDVKPHNVLVDAEGAPRLSDYGLARLRDDAHTRLTTSGQAVGTVSYMSPEQTIASRAGVDHRTDIYSLGVVLFEMLTLRLPFEGLDARELQQRIAMTDVPRPSQFAELPHDLETVVLHALERVPRDRYGSMRDLVEDLRRCRAARPVYARRPGIVQRLGRRAKRHAGLLATVSAFAVTGWLGAKVAFARDEPVCSVSIATATPGATVHVQRLEPISGCFSEPERVGVTPLELVTPLAVTRFVITDPEDPTRFAECTRRLVEEGEFTIDLELRRVPERPEDMVRIAGGVAPMPLAGPYAKRQVPAEVEPFLLDRTEVTNGAFARFLDGTGRERPRWWPETPDERFWTLPVGGVRYDDARAYAEWVGKRLPSRAEWQLAASGSEGRRYPWGDEPGDLRAWSALGVGSWQMVESTPEAYLRSARPVGTHPRDVVAGGVYDMLGNVREWTDSVGLESGPRGVVADLLATCIFGSSFAGKGDPLLVVLNWKPHALIARNDIGFRCARSLGPPRP